MLPPFVNDTVQWLRAETVLPLPARDAEPEQPDLSNGYALPFAAVLTGGIAALALLLFWALWLPPLAVAAATLAVLVAITGARNASGLVRAGDKLAASTGAGTAALTLVLLAEAAALAGLVSLHAGSAALALAAAITLGWTATLSFRLTQPADRLAEPGETPARPQGGALQGAMIAAIVIGVALLLPAYRLAPTAAAFVAALGAFVAVVAAARNASEADTSDFARAAGKCVEAAVLLAILAFTRIP